MTKSLPASQSSDRKTRPLGAWLIFAVLANILFCTNEGYGGDIAYWVDWISQLQRQGYANLTANYPPFYMHWLWLIGKFSGWLGITVAQTPLLRFLANTPVLVAHVLLVLLVNKLLVRAAVDNRRWNQTIGLTALNPAILLNGPVWGQVDLLFGLMLVMVLFVLIERRFLACAIPLLVMAVLTKFQSVCIAPVVLALLWHRRGKVLYRGIVLGAILGLLLLLPHWRAGGLWTMFDQTYLKAASIYPYASYHAQNLWYLIGLNERPDNLYIFDFVQPADSWRGFFTPKHTGMFLFAMWSLGLAISSFRRDENAVHWRNAILAALGFFLFLPAMHERYLVPAVIIAVAAAGRHPRFMVHAMWLSILVTANMAFILRPNGGLLPYVCSALTLLFAFWASADPLFARFSWSRLARLLPVRAAIILAILLWAIALGVHLRRELPNPSSVIDATTVAGRESTQEWGDLHIGFSVDNKVLAVGKKRVASGFGTHARSLISLPIPPNSVSFTAAVGLDEESTGGEVEFLVRADGADLWRSGPMRAGDAARMVNVDVRGRSRLELVVDPLGPNTSDHADWLEPRFYRAR